MTMADITVTVDAKLNQTISATITPNGLIDGPAVWTKDSGLATMTVAPDALSAVFTWADVSANDTTKFHVDGDVDLSPGAVQNITDTGTLILDFGGGGGGPATQLNLAFGVPGPTGGPTGTPPGALSRNRARFGR